LSHKPRRRRTNEEIKGKKGRGERRRKRKRKKKRSCNIFYKNKSRKGTLGAGSTLVGFFLAK
jgi:hypothetical protein